MASCVEKRSRAQFYKSDYNVSVFQVALFDLHRDDPLMLSSIVGEAIVSCMSIENISPKEKNGTYSKIKNKHKGVHNYSDFYC